MFFNVDYSITDEDAWFKAFPPRGKEKQWVDGYSAKEFAKAVLDKDFEKEISRNLGLKRINIDKKQVYPERGTSFDKIQGGVRSHDLACVATKNDNEKIALCFEAKVKETFGETIESELKNCTEGKRNRIEKLCRTFFGNDYIKRQDKINKIFYQLLTGLAGTIAFAAETGANESYFIVYQLYPAICDNKDIITEHKNAIEAFLKQFVSQNDIVDVSNIKVEKNTPIDLGTIELEDGKGTSSVKIVFMEKSFIN